MDSEPSTKMPKPFDSEHDLDVPGASGFQLHEDDKLKLEEDYRQGRPFFGTDRTGTRFFSSAWFRIGQGSRWNHHATSSVGCQVETWKWIENSAGRWFRRRSQAWLERDSAWHQVDECLSENGGNFSSGFGQDNSNVTNSEYVTQISPWFSEKSDLIHETSVSDMNGSLSSRFHLFQNIRKYSRLNNDGG